MKTQIILLSLMSVFLGNTVNKNSQNYDSNHKMDLFIKNIFNISISNTKTLKIEEKKFKQKLNQNKCVDIEETDTIEKLPPYRVIYSTTTLKYSIRKIGNGNKVLFCIKSGLIKLPGVSFFQNSGVSFQSGKKEGFDNVSFPFKCTLNCSMNYEVQSFDDRPSLINNFEIEINEPGYWEISFE